MFYERVVYYYTRILLILLSLLKLDEPAMQDPAREAETSSEVIYSYGLPHMPEQKQDDQLEPTYSRSVRIRDVALRTYQKRWTIGRSGERGSGISVLAARHDDDDDDIYIYIVGELFLSGKYPWEKYEHLYPPSNGLNSTTTVLPEEWLWH